MTLTITPLEVPASVDEIDAGFRALVDVRNRVGADLLGGDSPDVAPEQVLPLWREQADVAIDGWLLHDGDGVVGRIVLDLPLERGSRRAVIRVEVVPEARGRGIGRAALAFAEDRARERGRTVLQASTVHPASAAPSIPARSGAGAVPDDTHAGLLTAFGYDLEQVYRVSALDLRQPGDGIGRLLADARAASTGYRYIAWTTPTPPEWIDDYAWLKSRMSTDAPAADQEIDEEAWDAARIARMDSVLLDSGRTRIVGAAQHLDSRRLVAFTELTSFRIPGKPIDQDGTLVHSEHRGHRLGALVKCETLLRARDAFPEADRIVTDNAEENRPMLAINEAMGFRAVRYIGDWQKRI